MSWTKRQFIQHAFDEIGLSPFIYELGTEQFTAALRRLDAMMAAWNARGVSIGYSLPNTPESSQIDDRTGVPDSANEAIYLNLAIRVAPGFGKVVSGDTKVAARQAYDMLVARTAHIPERQPPAGFLTGAGKKGTCAFASPLSEEYKLKES